MWSSRLFWSFSWAASMCVEGLKRSPDKPSNNVLGERAMKGKVKKKSESNLAKSSTSLRRGGCREQKSNHLEEQTKLAGQSTVGLLASEQHGQTKAS